MPKRPSATLRKATRDDGNAAGRRSGDCREKRTRPGSSSRRTATLAGLIPSRPMASRAIDDTAEFLP